MTEEGDSQFIIESNSQFGDAPFEILEDVGKMKIMVKLKTNGEPNVDLVTVDIDNMEFKLGGNYQILIQTNEDGDLNTFVAQQVTKENEIHIFWLLPQFVIMTAGEIMFSITSLQFSFTQVQSLEVVLF